MGWYPNCAAVVMVFPAQPSDNLILVSLRGLKAKKVENMNPVPVWVMMASPWLGLPEESP